jgi:hypothetical protein
MSKVKLSVAEIREGDSFISNGAGWRAIEDAETFTNGEVAVRVRFEPDGGDRRSSVGQQLRHA